jgi:hypothetical protein
VGWFVSEERIPVEGLACRCPGSPHLDGDTVWLRKELTPEGGFAVLRAIRDAEGNVDRLPETLGRAYAESGIVDWTFLDADGEPVPCTPETRRQLAWAVVYPVAERGDGLYAADLLAPLAPLLSKSSRNGHSAPSTSATRRRSSTRRKP